MIEVFLVLIIALGTFFRFTQLTSLPIALFGDEIDVGYQAWSLISTGRDYMGHLLPTYIQSLAEWRAPLLMYLTAPFVGLFGTTDLAIRLPVALIGSLSIYLIYLLGNTLFKNKTTALISTLLLAITPWHIHFSRAAFEVVPLTFLTMLGTYLFLKGKYFASLIPFFLTFYAYSTAVVFTPLFVLALLLIERPKLSLGKNWPRLFLPSLLALPIVYNIFFGQAGGRFGLISIFSDLKIIESVILQRTDPWVQKTFFEVLFHNKYLAIATAFFDNYLTSFSPQFLFVNGDPFFRHSISKVGELLLPTLPLFLAGLYFIFKNFSQKNSKLLLFWLLLSPIPSCLTTGGGTHATRLFLMVPPLILISALGGTYLFSLFGKKFIRPTIILFIVFLGLFFTSFWHRYSSHYKYESASLWHYGFKNIFTDLKALAPNFDKVYINNTYQPSLLLFLFYTQYPPQDFQKNFVTDKVDTYQTNSFHGFVFDQKYFFGEAPNLDELKLLMNDRMVYLAVQGREGQGDWDWSKNPLDNTTVLASQKNIFGQPLFYLMSGTLPPKN
ncbi:MAG: hypothetical protein UW80_C0007G0019 [Microgenomates group bacterium GW2011_GWC1_44_9]|nr:MAG: hypothetical protein UW80_C0007G0019 [Microgenomates group bacterium GW2011_GWC1_44_9]